MLRVLPILLVVGAALYAFFEVISTPTQRFTKVSKGWWLLLALIPVIGAVLWFTVGRPKREPSDGPVLRLPNRSRPVAPDDDPAFLRQLDEQAWRARRQAKREREQQSGAPDASAETDEAPDDHSEPPQS